MKAVLSVSAFAAMGIFAAAASGQVTITIQQDGANVLVSGSGTVDTTGLTLNGYYDRNNEVAAQYGEVFIGSSNVEPGYAGLSGPTSFGGGSYEFANSSTGDAFGVLGDGGVLFLPGNYVSGDALSGTMTFDDTTIAELGLSDGTYTYTWDNGAPGDSLTVDIGGSVTTPPAATPEPSSLALLGSGVLGLAGVVRRRMRR